MTPEQLAGYVPSAGDELDAVPVRVSLTRAAVAANAGPRGPDSRGLGRAQGGTRASGREPEVAAVARKPAGGLARV